ncbi:MAG: hypothetical protein IJI65_07705 [Lachnospiraceae bacterium]|nr:hypothetical protein [Lachnospiraceae bacterium]
MKKIVFYGDSNTYGYDPRGFLSMRYPGEVRWTEKIRERFDGVYEIIEEGQNGRLLPTLPEEELFLKDITKDLSAEDRLFIMLGTNDILLTDHPDAKGAVQKMDRLLDWVKAKDPVFETIVIGPVPIFDESGDMHIYYEESRRMNAGFLNACKEREIAYFDAADWNISLAFDGVHFSEEGCRQFAEHIFDIISGEEGKDSKSGGSHE